MKDNKERLHWVDWAKTIGIILVVWAHISPIGMKEIFIFHMPLFFMISGILYKQRGFLPELKSSTCGLLIPYLLYNLLYMSPLPLGGERNIRTIVNVLLGNQEQLCYVMVPLWFLVSLFFMRLICSIKVIRIEVIGAASFVLSLLLFGYLKIDQTNDYFQLKTTCFCLPFFCIGYSLMKHVPIQRCKRKIIIGGASIIVLAASIFLGMLNTNAADVLCVNVFHCRFGANILLYYACSILASISIVILSWIFINRRYRVIEIISKGTLLILTLHIPIFWHIPQFISNNLIMAIINLIIIFAICMPLIILSEKYCPPMIGKRIELKKYER